MRSTPRSSRATGFLEGRPGVGAMEAQCGAQSIRGDAVAPRAQDTLDRTPQAQTPQIVGGASGLPGVGLVTAWPWRRRWRLGYTARASSLACDHPYARPFRSGPGRGPPRRRIARSPPRSHGSRGTSERTRARRCHGCSGSGTLLRPVSAAGAGTGYRRSMHSTSSVTWCWMDSATLCASNARSAGDGLPTEST